MRRISIFSMFALLLFAACTSESTNDDLQSDSAKDSVKTPKVALELFPCGTVQKDAFSGLKKQVTAIEQPDSLVKMYELHLDSLILNWEFLVEAENMQVKAIENTLNQIATHKGCNIEKVNELQSYLCLVESNRLPADKINNTERITMFDNLLDTLYNECMNQILVLGNVPLVVDDQEDVNVDADSLLSLINDTVITENFYAAENQNGLIQLNSGLYLESAAEYNQFIVKYQKELEERGLKGLEQFPGFYE